MRTRNQAALAANAEVRSSSLAISRGTGPVSGERLRILLLVEQPGFARSHAARFDPSWAQARSVAAGSLTFSFRSFVKRADSDARANQVQSVVKFTATSWRACY